MKIDLTRAQILEHADNYDYAAADDLGALLEVAAERGHMTSADLIAVAKWKWRGGRTAQLCEVNTEDEVVEITKASFGAQTERLRIGALLSLHGVKWPMASVILHFAFKNQYPILDVRAMNAVGGKVTYTYGQWLEYIDLCRKTAKDRQVDMRTLDKALWVYGK